MTCAFEAGGLPQQAPSDRGPQGSLRLPSRMARPAVLVEVEARDPVAWEPLAPASWRVGSSQPQTWRATTDLAGGNSDVLVQRLRAKSYAICSSHGLPYLAYDLQQVRDVEVRVAGTWLNHACTHWPNEYMCCRTETCLSKHTFADLQLEWLLHPKT